jgi:hypothetical protein
MAKVLPSEPNSPQTLYPIPGTQEVAYLRHRLVELDKGWRESYLGYQMQATAEIEYLRSELRLLVEKHMEQDKRHRQEKEHADRIALALGAIVGVAMSTVVAILLVRCG